jgi:hypothetical protein
VPSSSNCATAVGDGAAIAASMDPTVSWYLLKYIIYINNYIIILYINVFNICIYIYIIYIIMYIYII